MRVIPTRQSLEGIDMVQRVMKTAVSGWRGWVIGAALSVGCAALLLLRRQRSTSRTEPDEYEAWWERRAHLRANGNQPPAEHERSDPPQMFV
jgi:hypothetical protein